MKQTDFFEVTPWLYVTSNDFSQAFFLERY